MLICNDIGFYFSYFTLQKQMLTRYTYNISQIIFLFIFVNYYICMDIVVYYIC